MAEIFAVLRDDRVSDHNGAWMTQVARNLTDAASGFLKDARHLIVDRDPLYTAHFKEILASANVELLRLPARSPNLNAYAERFVGSIKSECRRHIVPIGRRHLEPSCGNTSSTITTSAITKASTTSSRCRSGNPARGRSDATNASAAYWATIGGRPHSAADRVFGQDGVPFAPQPSLSRATPRRI
jgi:transposase InsO family protein